MSKFSELVNGNIPVLVEIYAKWSTPSEKIAPILKEVKSSINNSIKIIRIDIDKNQQIADKFNIKGVPALLLFKNGGVIWKHLGLINKEDLITLIKEKT